MKYALSLVAACAGLMTVNAALSNCVQGCVDRVSADFSCSDPEFTDGILDCADKGCNDSSAASDYLDSLSCPGAGGKPATTTVVSTDKNTIIKTSADTETSTAVSTKVSVSTKIAVSTSVKTSGTVSTDTETTTAVPKKVTKTKDILSTVKTSGTTYVSTVSQKVVTKPVAGKTTIVKGGKGATSTSTEAAVAGVTIAAGPIAGALGAAALIFM